MSYKRAIFPLSLAIVLFFISIFNYFIPNTAAGGWTSELLTWITIMAAMMSWFGLINLWRVFIREIRTRRSGRWYLAIYGIAMSLIMLGGGFYAGQYSRGAIPNWLYVNILSWSSAATTSMIGLWGVRMTYKALRINTLGSLAFAIAAIVLMIKNSTIGNLIPQSLPASMWLMKYVYGGAGKGIMVGLGIGVIAFGIRFLLGREMTALGVPEEIAK